MADGPLGSDSAGFGQFLKTATANFDAGMSETAKARESVTKGAMGGAGALDQQLIKTASTPTPVPDAPKLQDVPDVPEAKFRNPMEAFGNFGSVLAIFGSLATRTPMTAALNAATAAIKGFHEGDQEVVKQNMQRWYMQTQKALQQNQKELEQYKAAMDKAGISMQDRAARLSALSAASRDQLTMANLQLNNITAIEENLRARLSAGIEVQKIQQDYELKMLLNQLRYGTLTPEQQKKNGDIMASRDYIKGLKKGELEDAMSSVSGMRTGQQQRILDQYKLSQTTLEQPRGGFGWGQAPGQATPEMATQERQSRAQQLLTNGAPREGVKQAWVDSGGTETEFEQRFPDPNNPVGPQGPQFGAPGNRFGGFGKGEPPAYEPPEE